MDRFIKTRNILRSSSDPYKNNIKAPKVQGPRGFLFGSPSKRFPISPDEIAASHESVSEHDNEHEFNPDDDEQISLSRRILE